MITGVLGGVARWVGVESENRQIEGSISSQGTCLGSVPGGARERGLIP